MQCYLVWCFPASSGKTCCLFRQTLLLCQANPAASSGKTLDSQHNQHTQHTHLVGIVLTLDLRKGTQARHAVAKLDAETAPSIVQVKQPPASLAAVFLGGTKRQQQLRILSAVLWAPAAVDRYCKHAHRHGPPQRVWGSRVASRSSCGH